MTSDAANEASSAGAERYDVVLLVEQELSALDAGQVRSLHEGIEAPVTYHVLLPMADAAAAVEASLGVIGGGDVLAPTRTMDPGEINRLRDDFQHEAEGELERTVAQLRAAGALVGSASVIEGPPVDALAESVQEVDGREAIILTRPHLVAEFFHLDWTSRARRHLGVPVLHLIEHETFDEQAGGGEGAEII